MATSALLPASVNSCCSTDPTKPALKAPCPSCGKASVLVSKRLVLQHALSPWLVADTGSDYYFCETPTCELIYFDQTGNGYSRASVRTAVGLKETGPGAVVCYCFGVTQALAQSDTRIRQFVIDQTKMGLCACDVRNPSGQCCLKHFPRHNKDDIKE